MYVRPLLIDTETCITLGVCKLSGKPHKISVFDIKVAHGEKKRDPNLHLSSEVFEKPEPYTDTE